MRTITMKLFALALTACAGNVWSQPTADQFATSLTTRFTVVGAAAPFTLTPNGAVSFEAAARLVLADMMALGYAPANPFIIDGRGATAPVPVIFQGCASAAGGTGTSLISSTTGVILLGVGFDGVAGSGDPGSNAWVQALATCNNATTYAVGGNADNAGGLSAGGWAQAYDLSGAGGGEGCAYAGDGVNGGAGGFAVARSIGANATAEGGDSDTGAGGNAMIGTVFGQTTGGNGTAWGGNTGGAGNGGSATVMRIGGNGMANGGHASGTGTGGLATVGQAPGAGLGPVPGTSIAKGGNGDIGGGGTCYSVGVASASGGAGQNGVGGNALARTTGVGGTANISGGSSLGGVAAGGSATATTLAGGGPNTVGPTGSTGGTLVQP